MAHGPSPYGTAQACEDQRVSREPSRIVGIEVLRCIAIAMVLIEHARHFAPAPIGWIRFAERFPMWAGVDLFLVVSGYVVTASLLRRPTPASEFLRKRAFRLLPACWSWALATYLLFGTLGGHLSGTSWGALTRDLAAAASMTMNGYLPWCKFDPAAGCGTPLALSVHWSLALEWQFYLFLPLLLCRGRWMALAIAGLGLLSLAMSPTRLVGATAWYFRYDGLLVGCLIALLQDGGFLQRFRPPTWLRMALIAGAVALLPIVSGPRGASLIVEHRFVLLALLGGIATAMAAVNVDPPSHDRIGQQAAMWLGERSYGLYLTHIAAMFVVGKILHMVGTTRLSTAEFAAFGAVAGVIALLWADASLRYLENPLRRLGARKADAQPALYPTTSVP